MENDRKKADEEECSEEVIPAVESYRGVMIECFDSAMVVMDQAELLTGEGLDAELLTRIALAIFSRLTMVSPAQDKIFGAGLDLICQLTKEKEADRQREEELRKEVPPFMASFGGIVSAPLCGHPGLRALYEQSALAANILGKAAEASTDKVIHAMTLGGPTEDSDAFLLCSHCRSLIPVEKYMSGELWDDLAEASRKAATESVQEGDQK